MKIAALRAMSAALLSVANAGLSAKLTIIIIFAMTALLDASSALIIAVQSVFALIKVVVLIFAQIVVKMVEFVTYVKDLCVRRIRYYVLCVMKQFVMPIPKNAE